MPDTTRPADHISNFSLGEASLCPSQDALSIVAVDTSLTGLVFTTSAIDNRPPGRAAP
jgi:hypothetical protein